MMVPSSEFNRNTYVPLANPDQSNHSPDDAIPWSTTAPVVDIKLHSNGVFGISFAFNCTRPLDGLGYNSKVIPNVSEIPVTLIVNGMRSDAQEIDGV